MHIMIVNFSVKGIEEVEYFSLCDQLAPAFAEQPGLIAKTWLADSQTNTYGGVYVWENQQAMEKFKSTDLFNSVATHPNLHNISVRDFCVVNEPTKITRGYMRAVA